MCPLCVHTYENIHYCTYRGIRVERDSLNSVIIDNEPQDKHERIMVSCYVELNPTGNTIVLRYTKLHIISLNLCCNRDTTLLPNIHGLSCLICMLFAPTAEMRYTYIDMFVSLTYVANMHAGI